MRHLDEVLSDRLPYELVKLSNGDTMMKSKFEGYCPCGRRTGWFMRYMKKSSPPASVIYPVTVAVCSFECEGWPNKMFVPGLA